MTKIKTARTAEGEKFYYLGHTQAVVDDNGNNIEDLLAEQEEKIELLNDNTGISEYPEFSTSKTYKTGTIVRHEGALFKFTSDHEPGIWDLEEVKSWSINAESQEKLTELGLEIDDIEFTIGSALSINNMNVIRNKYIQDNGSLKDSTSWNIYWVKTSNAKSVKCVVGGFASDEKAQAIAFYSGESVGDGFISSIESRDDVNTYKVDVPENCKIIVVGNRKSIFVEPYIAIKGNSSEIEGIRKELELNSTSIGILNFERYIDSLPNAIEQGAISGAGQNIPNELRLRTNVLSTENDIAIPKDYVIAFAFYYKEWQNETNFIFGESVEVNQSFYSFDKSYKYARLSIKKKDDTAIGINELYEKLRIIRPTVESINKYVNGELYLYQGGIDLLGVETDRTDRVRTNYIAEPFSISVNQGFKVYYLYRYDRMSLKFISAEEIDNDRYVSNGEYVIKLVITRENVSESLSPYDNIVSEFKGGLSASVEKNEKELNGDFVVLKQGGIDTTGIETDNANRVKSDFIHEHFKIVTNEDFKVYYAYFYNSDKSFIRAEIVDNKEFEYKGDYIIRLAFARIDTSANINPTDNIIKSYNGGLKYKVENAIQMDVVNSEQYIPDAKKTSLCFFPNRNGLWSDGIIWREIVGNNIYLNAKGYKTITIKDGVMIGGYNNSEVYELASVTKLMSLVVVCDNITDYNERVKVIESDVTWSTTDYYVQPNDEVTIDSLIAAAVIASDNTATQALARFVGYKINPIAATDKDAYDSFYNEMNKKAESLGMDNTIYANGAWNFGRSTANDQCLLLKKIQNEYARISEKWGLLNYDMVVYGSNARTYSIQSTTPQIERILLPEFVGGKTGTSNYMGNFAFVWKNLDGDLYASIVLQSPAVPDLRFKDSRRVIDEVYSLQKS